MRLQKYVVGCVFDFGCVHNHMTSSYHINNSVVYVERIGVCVTFTCSFARAPASFQSLLKYLFRFFKRLKFEMV